MTILIKGGRILDPATKTDDVMDLFIEDGVITKRGKNIKKKAEKTIDAKGLYVMPGLVDMHVHLRDPGFTHKGDVETETRSAARGGYTTVLAMPNTKPVVDNADVVRYVHHKAESVGLVHVLQVGAVTKGQQGEELADIKEMVEAGSPAISEDGKSVMNSLLARDAMLVARDCNIPVLSHCEDKNLVGSGVVNEDENAKRWGLAGITNSVEDIMIARNILLSKDTGAHLHLCHCSTKNSVIMVKYAKLEHIPVSAEVCPHHFTLTSDDMVEGDTNYKMNPPLRSEADRKAAVDKADAKARQVSQKEAEIELYATEGSASLRKVEQQKREAIMAEIYQEIRRRAAAEGYAFVLDSSGKTMNEQPTLLLCPPSSDFTAAVLTELNRTRTKKVETPAPKPAPPEPVSKP